MTHDLEEGLAPDVFTDEDRLSPNVPADLIGFPLGQIGLLQDLSVSS